MTKAERRAELVLELADIKKCLTIICKGGQSYTITSGSSGTSRTVTNANLKDVLQWKNDIEGQIASLDNQRATRIRPAW